jgi:RNA polymerase sigma-70 factor (ECF subfamily)
LLLLARVHIDTKLQAKADPSDLVQETCLMDARDLPQFRGETVAELVAWLRQILANTGAAMIRKYKGTQSRDVGREQQFEQQLDRSSIALGRLLTSPESSPSRIASRREAAVVLADTLARLPEEYREVLVLFHLEGLSLAEVAARMGRTIPSIRGLRTRAVLKLRTIMKEPA